MLFLMLGMCGGCLRMGTFGTITAKVADASNRGKIFGYVAMSMNFGRMVGPVVGGHLAERDPVLLPWVFAGICCFVSAVVLIPVQLIARRSSRCIEPNDVEPAAG